MTDSEKTTSRFRTVDLAYIALFAVLMAVCAWITIPIPKPFVQFTLQTFAVFMALITLGGRRGLYVTVVYLLMGAVGVPVFSGFRGGLSVLLDTTGGYIIGFVASALVYWLVTSRLGESLPVVIAAFMGREGELLKRSDVASIYKAREVRVAADPPLTIQYDGEPTGILTPFRARALPRTVNLVVSERVQEAAARSLPQG